MTELRTFNPEQVQYILEQKVSNQKLIAEIDSQEPFTIPPLQWRESEEGDGWASYVKFAAYVIYGTYLVVCYKHDQWAISLAESTGRDEIFRHTCDSLEDAKAIAEADWRQRMRSALIPVNAKEAA